MKNIFRTTVITLIFLSLNSGNISAQELSHGKFGISAAINGSQGDILIPLWLDNYNSLAPSVGVINIQDAYTDLTLGLVYHHYFQYSKNFAPFLGGRVGVLLALPKSGTETTDYIAGLAGGGEYFFSSNFSVGVEAQLNFTFSDTKSTRFGNPGGTNWNTGSVIFASVYF